MQETIALVFDFDDTLAPDTTWGFLENYGLKPASWWQERVDPLVVEGWDPIPAYLYAMIQESKSRPVPQRITRKKLSDYGRSIRLHEGVTRIFDKLSGQAVSVWPDVRSIA